MTRLSENSIRIPFGVAFVAMHGFGHGSHGGHGSHAGSDAGPNDAQTRRAEGPRPTGPTDATGTHRRQEHPTPNIMRISRVPIPWRSFSPAVDWATPSIQERCSRDPQRERIAGRPRPV